MLCNQPAKLEHSRGQKHPFTLEQINQLDKHLRTHSDYRNLAILWLSIDSFLRSTDLLGLRVGDVVASNGEVLSEIHVKQRKTGEAVTVALGHTAEEVIQLWLIESGKQRNDFLFTRTPTAKHPLSTSALRRLVKRWAAYLGLQVEHYAAHSLRRTKAAFLYQQGVRIEYLQLLLGHSDLKNTTRYLGIEKNHALHLARSFDLRHDATSPENRPKHLTRSPKRIDNEAT